MAMFTQEGLAVNHAALEDRSPQCHDLSVRALHNLSGQ